MRTTQIAFRQRTNCKAIRWVCAAQRDALLRCVSARRGELRHERTRVMDEIALDLGTARGARMCAVVCARTKTSRRNPKSAPGFDPCRGRTECRVPHRVGFDAPLTAQRGVANPARTRARGTGEAR